MTAEFELTGWSLIAAGHEWQQNSSSGHKLQACTGPLCINVTKTELKKKLCCRIDRACDFALEPAFYFTYVKLAAVGQIWHLPGKSICMLHLTQD